MSDDSDNVHFSGLRLTCSPYLAIESALVFLLMHDLLVSRTEHHLSSFKYCFVNIFSRQNLLRSLSRLLFLLRWNPGVEQIWREKMSEKPHSIRHLWWFNFSQSGSRRNNRRTFEGGSMERRRQDVFHKWISRPQNEHYYHIRILLFFFFAFSRQLTKENQHLACIMIISSGRRLRRKYSVVKIYPLLWSLDSRQVNLG